MVSKLSRLRNLPRVASRANHSDWGAGNTNNRIDVLDDNAQEAENLGDGGVARFSSTVAALNRPSVALTGRDWSAWGTSCGGSKGSSGTGECEESESHELHVGLNLRWVNDRCASFE